MDKRVEYLLMYFQTLVDDGLLQVGSVDPVDCRHIIGELDKIEQEQRTMEFAV